MAGLVGPVPEVATNSRIVGYSETDPLSFLRYVVKLVETVYPQSVLEALPMKCIPRFLVIVVLTASAWSQQTAAPKTPAATPPTTKDPVTASIRTLLPRSQKNILAAIDVMPADKFSYKPTPDQITFGHLVVHITESNNSLCAKAADVPAPKAAEVKDTDPKDKLLSAAKESFDFCGEALGKMDDSKLGDSVELFGGHQFPRAMAVLGLASGWADHYGAAAMYLRLNGILPPTAQPKK